MKGCRFYSALLGLLASVVFGSAFAQQAIMVTGDSIFAGFQRPSFRLPLLDEFAANGCVVDMVGDQTVNSFDYRDPQNNPGENHPDFTPALGYDTDHQAFPGIRTEQLRDGVSSAFFTVSPISAYTAIQQPDYVLLHIGTNDLALAVNLGDSTAKEMDDWANQTIDELESMIDSIIAAHNNPASLKILVGNFIPYKGPFTNQSQIDAAALGSSTFTRKLEEMVAAKADARVLIVDVATGFDVDTMTTDNIHPNQVGEEQIAGAYLPVLAGAGLVCSPAIPFISSPANGSTVAGEPLTINWDDNGVTADAWRVYVGDSQSGDSATYFDSGVLGSAVRTVSVPSLPEDGFNVFISLNYEVGGVWQQALTSFISDPSSPQPPSVVSPVPGTVLPGSDVTFTWADNGTDVFQFYFRAGASAGAQEYASFRIFNGQQRSTVIEGLPTDGSPVFIEYSYRLPSGTWFSEDLEYTAFGASTNTPPVADNDAAGPIAEGATVLRPRSRSDQTSPPKE